MHERWDSADKLQDVPDLPATSVTIIHDPIPASTAVTKLTGIIYQQGIHLSKHKCIDSNAPDINSIMSNHKKAYSVNSTTGYYKITLADSSIAYKSSQVYTNLSYIINISKISDMLRRSYNMIALVEKIDDIALTELERVSVPFLFAFIYANITSATDTDKSGFMKRLGLDWHILDICSKSLRL